MRFIGHLKILLLQKVMSDGTVKAKKKGSVKIYADIYTDDGEFYDDLQWTVTVMPKNPSFKSVSKKMKSFKQKYLKYKLVKKQFCMVDVIQLSGIKKCIQKGLGILVRFIYILN